MIGFRWFCFFFSVLPFFCIFTWSHSTRSSLISVSVGNQGLGNAEKLEKQKKSAEAKVSKVEILPHIYSNIVKKILLFFGAYDKSPLTNENPFSELAKPE